MLAPALAGIRAKAAGAAEPSLRVAATANDTYAEAYYAHDMGFFTQAGLDAAVSTFTSGAAVATAVAGGAADVGISNPVTLAIAVQHGFPFIIIAGGGLYSSEHPTTGLCVARSSAIRTAKDLEGKTVAVSALNDQNALGVEVWLSANGADPSKVRLIELAFSQMGAALERGTVAAATIPEPSLTASKDEIRVLAPMFDAIAKHFMIGGWFTTTQWLDRNRDVAARFAKAIYRTAAWANGHPNESVAILAKYSKVSPRIAHTMTRCRYAESLTPDMIASSLSYAYKYKILERPFDPSTLIARV